MPYRAMLNIINFIQAVDYVVPGFAAEFDPDEAQRAGAFAEDALSEADAADSAIDLEGAWAAHTRQGI